MNEVINGISLNLEITFLIIFKTNTYNKNLRARAKGPILLELFPFVILHGFCIDSFLNILKSYRLNFIKTANTFLSSRQILIIKTKS